MGEVPKMPGNRVKKTNSPASTLSRTTSQQCPHYVSSHALLGERHRRLPWGDVGTQKHLIK
jgi:hypothetical protein